MTIYEYLGINDTLLDISIPQETIINNISDTHLQSEANYIFNVIDDIKLRVSINRNEHYLQVIEINLNSPLNIERISYLVQKAIKYRILFVFVYDKRFLLLWRDFYLNENTDNVYTYHKMRCSEWIYEEYLCADILYYYQSDTIDLSDDQYYTKASSVGKTYNDNGDSVYFLDLLNNVVRLNNCIIECEVISARNFLDWLETHSIGKKIDHEALYEAICSEEAYMYINDHLFLDKCSVQNSLLFLEYPGFFSGAQYRHSLDYTGKNPTEYFVTVLAPATYDDECMLSRRFSEVGTNLEEMSTYKTQESPEYHGMYGNIPYVSESTFFYEGTLIKPTKPTHQIINQGLSDSVVLKLRVLGYQYLEDLINLNYSNLTTLTTSERVELIICMDKYSFRMKDCGLSKYPRLNTFIRQNVKCLECSAELQNYDWRVDNQLCPDCITRHLHLAFERNLDCELTRVRIINSYDNVSLAARINIVKKSDEITSIKVKNLALYSSGNKELYNREVSNEESDEYSLYGIETESITFPISLMFDQDYAPFLDSGRIEIQILENNKHAVSFIFSLHKLACACSHYASKLFDYIDVEGFEKCAEEARRLEEERKKAEEALRLEEERKKAEEARRLEEERKKAEEARRLEEERKKAEEALRLEEEQKKAEEALRLEEERKKAEEAQRLEEERKKAEEAQRLEEERKKAEEAQRLEEERKKAEEARRLEEERKKAEEALRLEEEQKKAKKLKDECSNLIYQSAISKIQSNDIALLTDAIVQLESLKGWKDSDQVVMAFRNKISIITRENDNRKKELYRSRKLCQHCGGKFKGLFTKVCTNCGVKKDY